MDYSHDELKKQLEKLTVENRRLKQRANALEADLFRALNEIQRLKAEGKTNG